MKKYEHIILKVDALVHPEDKAPLIKKRVVVNLHEALHWEPNHGRQYLGDYYGPFNDKKENQDSC